MTPKTPPTNWKELVEQIQYIVKTLYIGNGQEAVLPRLSRIEALLESAAEADKKVSENLEESNRIHDSRSEQINDKLDKLVDAVKALEHSVDAHHKSLHLKDLLKSAQAWFFGFVIFTIYHTGAEYIANNGGNWVQVFLKFIGVK